MKGKGSGQFILKSLVITSMIFFLSMVTTFAREGESTENSKAVESAGKEEVITVTVTPATQGNKASASAESFALKKSESNNNKLNLSLTQKNDINLSQRNAGFFNDPLKKNANVNPEMYKGLQRNIRSQTVEKTFFTSTLVTLAALNIADYLSTKEALKHEGLTEGNPMMKPFVKNPYVFAAVKIGMTALTSTYLHKLYKKNKKLAWIMSTVSNFALSYVVVHNINMINKVKNN